MKHLNKIYNFTFLFIISTNALTYNLAAYSIDQLKTLEHASAVAKTAHTTVKALAPTTSPALDFSGNIAEEINLLAAYALLEETSFMPLVRILDRISERESWQYAPQFNKDFMLNFSKEFLLDLSHGVTLELFSVAKATAVEAALPSDQTTKTRLLQRAMDIVLTALAKPIITATFYALEKMEKPTQDEVCSLLTNQLLTTFYTELAYHSAGEIIRLEAK